MSVKRGFLTAFAGVLSLVLLTSCGPAAQQPPTGAPADSIYAGLTDDEDGLIDTDIDLSGDAAITSDEAGGGGTGLSGLVGGSAGGRTGYILVGQNGNEVIAEQQSGRPRTMASVTKIATSLAALRSVPGINVEKVAAMLRSSDNFSASMLLRRFAKAVAGIILPPPRVRSPHSCGHGGSEDAPAADLLLNWLKKNIPGDWSGASLADGSGCSPSDKMSPAQIVRILRYADSLGSAFGGHEFADLLAKGGSSGTLRSRLGRLDGHARVYAKTGTLASAVTLAGYLIVPSQKKTEQYYFAILSDVDDMGEARAGRKRIDGLVKSWARQLAN